MQLDQIPLKPFPNKGPIVVAVSGGGDSMALLGLCLEQAGGRQVHALIVDHGLRDGSAQQAEQTAQRCTHMGARAQILTWTPSHQSSAIQERARKARYGLMGQACRVIGAAHLLVGHTQDDQAETIYIRRECGSGWRGLAGMAARQYAPVWPQLYDIHLLRPLLGISRADLRSYNQRKGIIWLEDPSNENTDFHRVRARKALIKDRTLGGALYEQLLQLGQDNRARRQAERSRASALAQQVDILPGSAFALPLSGLSEDGAHLLLAQLILCASGQSQQADMPAIERLFTRLQTPDFKSATLGGALIMRASDPAYVQISKETGRWLAENSHIAAPKGKAIIFDGRYEVTLHDNNLAHDDDLTLGSLWPARAQMSPDQRRAMKQFPTQIRPSLFGVFRGQTLIDAPELTNSLSNLTIYLEDKDALGRETCTYRHLTETRFKNGFGED